MHQIPRHKGRVALREFVFLAARIFVHIRRSRSGFADPAGVGLRRNRVAEMLERIENVHRAMLDAVFVAGDDAAARFAVIDILPEFVGLARFGVEPLDDARADRGFFAEPDRRAENQEYQPSSPF